ncbi:MAG TPA: BPSS1780 family membrane protein [Chitinolyticbacter sp.]|nr:BPSS1780 family membrane protein [Chitinolyticbacter sp.]
MQQNEIVIDTAPEPRRVGAMAGWQWLVNAWALYKRDWLQWTGMTALLMVILMVLSIIPLVSVAATLLMPVMIGGMMQAADRSRRGESFEVTDLFNGFKQNTGELILVGLFYLIAMMGVMIVLGLLAAVVGLAAYATDTGMDGAGLDISSQGVTVGIVLFGVLCFFALLAVYSTYFFAPTLVMLRGMKAAEAMKLSALAFWRNIWAILLYSVMVFVAALIAVLPFLLGLIVLMPVGMLVSYTSFIDIFGEEN